MDPRLRKQPGDAFTPALPSCSKHSPTKVGLEQPGAQALPCHTSVLPPKPESSITQVFIRWQQHLKQLQFSVLYCRSEFATAATVPVLWCKQDSRHLSLNRSVLSFPFQFFKENTRQELEDIFSRLFQKSRLENRPTNNCLPTVQMRQKSEGGSRKP